MQDLTYVLGGFQTDFARNWHKENLNLSDLISSSVNGVLDQNIIDLHDIECAHIGNFVGELFCDQGQLGGMLISQFPQLAGIPVSRHEAACASGSMAVMAAIADLKSKKHQTALVLGVEMMRNCSSQEAADYLGVAAWNGKEGEKANFMWPYLFSKVYDYYAESYGLNHDHLNAIAKTNLSNAKLNPKAQTRDWNLGANYFDLHPVENPIVEGQLRKSDCGRITDGGAAIILASPEYAYQFAKKHNLKLEDIPCIKGWGHTTAPLSLAEKLVPPKANKYPFPFLKKAIDQAYEGARLEAKDIDLFETHDCFTISEYVAIEHFGLSAPGQAWKRIEKGDFERTGHQPINPSGGLIGCGHPVGATGVRMLLDAHKQLTHNADTYQIDHVKNVCCLNFGGSFTTTACFVVGMQEP